MFYPAFLFYQGLDDVVRCVFCTKYIRDWEKHDHPFTEHQKLQPFCPFVQGHNVGNISENQISNAITFEAGNYCRIIYKDQPYECQIMEIVDSRAMVHLIGHGVNIQVDDTRLSFSFGKSARAKQDKDAKFCNELKAGDLCQTMRDGVFSEAKIYQLIEGDHGKFDALITFSDTPHSKSAVAIFCLRPVLRKSSDAEILEMEAKIEEVRQKKIEVEMQKKRKREEEAEKQKKIKKLKALFEKESKILEKAESNLKGESRKKKVAKKSKPKVECNTCKKMLGTPSDLKRHIEEVHEKKRTFICDECQEAFSRSNYLATHIKVTHQNEKIFVCDLCKPPTNHSRYTNLQAHIAEVHDNIEYVCELCECAFKRPGRLQEHMKQFH